MKRILDKTVGYGTKTGIQPSNYVASLKVALAPEYNVIEHPNWSISGISSALRQNNVAIVDIHVDSERVQPASPPMKYDDGSWSHKTYAHFAQVLAIDSTSIYLDNSLWTNESQRYWTISHPLFMEAWSYPETSSNLSVPAAEDVTNWGVEIMKVGAK